MTLRIEEDVLDVDAFVADDEYDSEDDRPTLPMSAPAYADADPAPDTVRGH